MRQGGPAIWAPRLTSGLVASSLLLACVALAPPPLHAQDTTAAVDDEPPPVTLVRPADGAAVPGSRRGARVGLAWRGPRAPPLWYFVEVLASGPGEAREVFTGYTRQTELRVRLDGAGRYAWRVVAVSRERARYSVSPWRSFAVEDAR
jgi:hypothetical protein